MYVKYHNTSFISPWLHRIRLFNFFPFSCPTPMLGELWVGPFIIIAPLHGEGPLCVTYHTHLHTHTHTHTHIYIYIYIYIYIKVIYIHTRAEVKNRPHDIPRRIYSFLTSALDKGERSTPRPGSSYLQEIAPVCTVKEAGWPSGPVWLTFFSTLSHKQQA
jgi:hypothetical protein